jgi:hypothetical protein
MGKTAHYEYFERIRFVFRNYASLGDVQLKHELNLQSVN